MLIVCLLLWAIGLVVIIKDYKTESAWWLMLVAFFSGLGAFSTFIHENIVLNLIAANELSQENIDLLYTITAAMSATVHNIDPYCMLLYGISSANIIPKNKKKMVYVLLFIPSILSYIFIPIKSNVLRTPEEIIIHFRLLSIWTVPYMLGGSFFLIYAYIKEKSYKLKRYRLLNAILAVPYLIYAAIANFILRDFGIENNWRFFIVLIPILFLGFIYFAAKYGVFGVRLKFEKYKFAFEDIFNHISDSFIALNENFSIIEVNRMYFENFNKERKKYSTLYEIIADNSILSEYGNALIELINRSRDGDVSTIEIAVNYEDGNKYFEVQANPIVSNGEYFGTIMVFKDITAHKKVIQLIEENQSQIIENARLESLGNLIGGIAHNLKTPLMSSSGAIDIISDNINNSINLINESNIEERYKAEIGEYFKKVDKWKKHIKDYLIYMNDVISTVRDQIHITSNNTSRFSISELINKISILMSDELKKHKCVLRYKLFIPEETEISGSVNYLLQVLNILISNAKDAYKGDKGEIELIVEKDGPEIIIKVKDYGKGILESIEDKIFNQMVTTKGKDGSGLGLYISRTIIKTKFRGNIGFNKDEKGSTFFIEIPQKDA